MRGRTVDGDEDGMVLFRRKLKDVDAAAAARLLQAFGWLSVAGMAFGALVARALRGGMVDVFLGGLLGIVIVGGVGGGLVFLVTDRIGGMARVIHNPTGESTPHRREYSYAKSLAARGEYRRAMDAYRASIEEDSRDPTPYLAIARILRDELGAPEDAAGWFLRARRDAQLSAGEAMHVARELIELYRTKRAEPLRAAPELARLVETWPETPEGRWARAELAALKRAMAEEAGPE